MPSFSTQTEVTRMTLHRYRILSQKISNAILAKGRAAALYSAMARGREARSKAFARLEGAETFREDIRTIKQDSIERLEELLGTFSENARQRGAKVYLASNAEDANHYIVELAKARNVRLVSKSKSLTSEEIELNKFLEAEGIKVVETDLGERIIQLAKEKPFHLVLPAIHKTRQEVAELFSAELQKPVSDDMESLMKTVRESLREVFLHSDMGISGANIAIAQTGTIVVETNEGNARLVTSIPKIHVVIVGVEKIVGTMREAAKLIVAHPMSATGQRLTNYVSFISGRLPLAGNFEGRELHIVILDNGRLRMRDSASFREALYCIRCGACMNVCPTYGVVGGHVFGYIYPGPIGIPWTAEVHGLDKAAEFAPLCISCGLCKEICPADIDIPMMIARVKQQDIEANGQLLVNEFLSEAESFARVACAMAPASNWLLRRKTMRIIAERLIGIDRRRPLPEFAKETFLQWFRKRESRTTESDSKAVYFVDLYANYNDPQLGKMAVELLEEADVQVAVPPQKSSGMPYVSYGELKKAEKVALYNIQSLYPFATKGFSIVSTEPTASYMLKFIYPKLLGTPESNLVAQHSIEIFEFLSNLKSKGRVHIKSRTSGKVGFHISCHQRALSSGKFTVSLLREIGLDVKVIETGTCCGMAGTFGMKRGPLGFDLSEEVGKPLFELFLNSGVDFIATESSVCKIHLEQGTGLRVEHPLKIVKAAFER